jgi:hypothetical protein
MKFLFTYHNTLDLKNFKENERLTWEPSFWSELGNLFHLIISDCLWYYIKRWIGWRYFIVLISQILSKICIGFDTLSTKFLHWVYIYSPWLFIMMMHSRCDAWGWEHHPLFWFYLRKYQFFNNLTYCLKVFVLLKFDSELSVVFCVEFCRKVSKTSHHVLLRWFFLQSVYIVQWHTEIFSKKLDFLAQDFVSLCMDNI